MAAQIRWLSRGPAWNTRAHSSPWPAPARIQPRHLSDVAYASVARGKGCPIVGKGIAGLSAGDATHGHGGTYLCRGRLRAQAAGEPGRDQKLRGCARTASSPG